MDSNQNPPSLSAKPNQRGTKRWRDGEPKLHANGQEEYNLLLECLSATMGDALEVLGPRALVQWLVSSLQSVKEPL